MTAPHPRMHGLTHVAGGPDPIPWLLAGGDYDLVVTSIPDLLAYWRLGETAGPWADTSGHLPPSPLHLAAGTVPLSAHVTGALTGTAEDGAVQFNYDGLLPPSAGGGDSLASTGDVSFGLAEMTVACYATVTPSSGTRRGLIVGNSSYNPSSVRIEGWGLEVTYPDLKARFTRGVPATGGGERYAETPAGLVPTTWYHLCGTFDGTTIRLYLNGTLAASTADSSGATTIAPVRVGVGSDNLGQFSYFTGAVDEAAVWERALTDSEVAALYAAGIGGGDVATGFPSGGADEGDVLTADGSGGTVYAPPAVEVSGGGLDDTTPDDTPVDSDSGPYAGTPTNSSGWHLEAHTEIVFLVDSTRGRFDVPTMKWTRVPFNTIRILRTWEPTVDADVVKTAWLPDDRGLSGPARDGVLHVNSGMAWSGDQLVQGWISIEYPVLNPFGLPDDDPEVPGFGPRPGAPGTGLAARDSYMRALRPFNLSTGSVLHMPSSGDPAFLTWHFWDEAHVMEEGGYPPPTYPIWPARPMHLPPPYPQLSPTDSRGYYVNEVGDPGWRFDKLSVATTLAAGANLCLQAWQDSPWLIRFSTDRFPAFHGYTGTYRGYPYLYISFAYDPDTIDHDTGKLLLPAP